jgi:hypothetical protein
MTAVKAGRYEAFVVGTSPSSFPLSVSVYTVGTTTAATLYTDHIAGTAASNPVTTSALGAFHFFAAPGDYDLVFQVESELVRHTITIRDDPQNSVFSQNASANVNKITFGAGAPTAVPGIIGDVYIRNDDVGTHGLYQCSVASVTAATWVAMVN